MGFGKQTTRKHGVCRIQTRSIGLIFLKFASDKFEEHRKAMIDKGQEKYIEMPDFYGQANVLYLDENIDFEENMQSLQTEFAALLKAEEDSKKDLLTVFKELGYEIKL